MKTLRFTVCPLLLAAILAGVCFGEEAELASSQQRASPAAEAELSWLDRIDKIHEPGYMNWITSAWATMLLEQGIISAEDAPEAARVVLQLWEFDFAEDERAWDQFYKDHYFFVRRLDEELAGMMMIVRTQPSGRQMLVVTEASSPLRPAPPESPAFTRPRRFGRCHRMQSANCRFLSGYSDYAKRGELSP